MSRAKPIDNLFDPIANNPERMARVRSRMRAIETSDKLSDLLERSGDVVPEGANGTGDATSLVLEHDEDVYFAALRDQIALLGGELEVKAVFSNHAVTLVPTQHGEPEAHPISDGDATAIQDSASAD